MKRFLLVLTGLVLSLAGAQSSGDAAASSLSGRIAAAMVFGDRLVSINPDGTASVVLSYAHDTDPAWSPDGSALAVSSGDTGNGDIFVLSPDGRQRRQITTSADRESDPAWAPGGAWLAYERVRDDSAIYAVNADGLDPHVLADSAGCDADPAFSPDGTLIAFTSCRSGSPQIYVMNVDGSEVVRVTHNDGYDADPAWSPDGSQIAYSSSRPDGQRIYVIRPDGTDDRSVTSGPDDLAPAWSPDGRELIYVSGPDFTLSALSLQSGGVTEIAHGVRTVAWQAVPNGEPACTHAGTSAADVLGGATRSDLVCGAAGNDRLSGGPGLDILRGGDGDDVLNARDGVADVIDGGAGFDSAFVDRGDRTVDVENVNFPEPRNLARGRPVTTSWDWADSSAEFAVDGLGTGSPLWWGSYYAPQWIEVDLGGPKTIRSIELFVAQYPAGETIHAIRGRDSSGKLKLLRLVAGYTGDKTVIRVKPKRSWRGIRAVRVSTLESPSWVAWKEIRVLR
jgi:dipeptidyl aminopeptidase/acylaminoacyl peptidase